MFATMTPTVRATTATTTTTTTHRHRRHGHHDCRTMALKTRTTSVVVRAGANEGGDAERKKVEDTMSNLDKLLGDYGAAPMKDPAQEREEADRAAQRANAKPALDAAAQAEAKSIAADLAAAQARIRREKSNSSSPVRKSMDGDDEEYDFSERAIAALVYMLPLLDGLKYSKFLFMQAPALSLVLLPIAPLIQLWGSLGFLQVVVFFGTYLGVVQNQNMKRFVRFNAQQAVLLDILLIVPDLLTRTFQGIDGSGPTGGVGLQAEILFFNTVFFFTYLSCTAGAVQSARGKTIKLPLIGDAADAQQPR